MHIAADGSIWGGDERGVAVATRRLWMAYVREYRPAQTTLFAPESLRSTEGNGRFVAVGPLRGLRRFYWQQAILPRLLHDGQVDILYSPAYTSPVAARCRLVTTMHDVIAWSHPGLAGWRNAGHLRLLAERGLRRSSAICVPTESVRSAVVKRFAVSRERVFVVPWGSDEEVAPVPRDEALAAVRAQFGVEEPFLLFCGCLEPKKNVLAAAEAAETAGLLLLIAGPAISTSPPLLRDLGRVHGARWRYLGRVPTPSLNALYSSALALLLPSHVEGFGLPAIEAMRCGCPVIASNDPALREVCGGAALHPAQRSTTYASMVQQILRENRLREDLAARGRDRARAFTWKAAAARFAEAMAWAEAS